MVLSCRAIPISYMLCSFSLDSTLKEMGEGKERTIKVNLKKRISKILRGMVATPLRIVGLSIILWIIDLLGLSLHISTGPHLAGHRESFLWVFLTLLDSMLFVLLAAIGLVTFPCLAIYFLIWLFTPDGLQNRDEEDLKYLKYLKYVASEKKKEIRRRRRLR